LGVLTIWLFGVFGGFMGILTVCVGVLTVFSFGATDRWGL